MRSEFSEHTWWSPDPRGIVPLDDLRVTRSLRKSIKHFRTTVDAAFVSVVDACADRPDEGVWITDAMRTAYIRLHEFGWAHSVEAWAEDGTLAGGLYGVAVGGLFAGESMFYRRRDASKVALVALVDLMRGAGDPSDRLLDVQWTTPHLRSLGAIDVPRAEYLHRLGRALELPPPAFDG
jgi:leucyl/phenylalanyl-tRNA--protein transferase